MIIEEINIDLFDFWKSNNRYILLQCISSDFSMGKGIAVKFNSYFNCKNIIKSKFIPYWANHGYTLSLLPYNIPIINLVTKENYWGKPTYKSLKESLEEARKIIELEKIYYIAMPKIGTGLDKLEYNKVKVIIEEVFKDMEIDIKICYL